MFFKATERAHAKYKALSIQNNTKSVTLNLRNFMHQTIQYKKSHSKYTQLYIQTIQQKKSHSKYTKHIKTIQHNNVELNRYNFIYKTNQHKRRHTKYMELCIQNNRTQKGSTEQI